jgi:uncharacterized protein YrrD
MRLGKDLVGKPIYSLTDGRHLGTVKDIYLDQSVSLMVGVFLGQEGLFKRKSIVIPREHITVIGIDAVLTSDSDAVRDSGQLPEVESWLRREVLQGRPVDTPGGTKVGTVGDVLLDQDAQIVGFALARVFVEGPVAESRMVMKSAVVDEGAVDGVMTVDLALAEQAPGAEEPVEEASTAEVKAESEETAPAEGDEDVSSEATAEAAKEEEEEEEPQNEA